MFVFGFPYQSVFVPLIAVQALDVGGAGAGFLISVVGIGALAGALTVATVGDRLPHKGLVMIAMIVVYSFALLAFSRAPSVPFAIPALILAGAMQTSFMSVNNAYVLTRTPPELQGRVMSLFSLDRGLIPLGAALGGLLAAAIGPQDGLAVMALICLGGTMLMVLIFPAMRKLN